MCAVAIPETHAHVVDLDKRGVVCACRPCYLLFLHPGAGGRKYRAVPERYLRADDLTLTEAQWDEFQIPVGMAFFFHNSSVGRTLAFYPSPAGATESTLPLEAWRDLVDTNPLLETLEPDVEALLVRHHAERFECYVVPIDACYELVGRIRRHWRGFHGGEEAWRQVGLFFDGLRQRTAQGVAS